MSSAEYGVVTRHDIMIPMRDGTCLATDIYLPADQQTGQLTNEQFPVLLVRTPYDKRAPKRVTNQGKWFAKHGYVVALQDVRGRFNSQGSFYLLKNEAEDGYDTVEWLGTQDFCDGQVGTMGTSYMAWVQNALASLNPPHLAAMFVNQGAANAWKATFRHNGAMELRWLTWAFTYGAGFSKQSLDDPVYQERFASVDTRDVLENAPVIKGQSPLHHDSSVEDWIFNYLTANGDAEQWDSPSLNFEKHVPEAADVPTVYAGAWYDSYGKATSDNFIAYSKAKEADQFLIMGPWTHGTGVTGWTKKASGDAYFGSSATRDYQSTRLRFFDHYLKNQDSWNEPTVQYYTMGTGDGTRLPGGKINHGGHWNTAPDWPLPATDFTGFYAHSDGSLRETPPTEETDSTTFLFDPTDPVPTIGGNCSSYYTFEQREESVTEYPLDKRQKISLTKRGGYDQRTREDTLGATKPNQPLEQRDDIIVFRTPPLTEPVTIAGPLSATVYGSSDAPDTDFTVKLIDEYPPSESFPNGFALNLADSICRARYRGYRREADHITPGDVYEFYMEPYPTANVFGVDHRIRIDISSSNYPRYDVNHNTGGPLYGGREKQVAENTIYHEMDHPTRITLPLQPETN